MGELKVMRKILFLTFGVLLLGALSVSSQQSMQGVNPPGRTLQVQLHYTGSGAVDANHKIYVGLWDSADSLASGAPPVSVQPAASKNALVTFSNVQKVPVFVSVAYDPTGKWDAQSAPPAGTSMGLYSKAPPKPDPIDIADGKTARITLSFDDSVKAH
jgi:hypothetical protein